MLVISQAGTGPLLATTTSAAGANLRAYALALPDHSTEVVLVNKDTTSAVAASVSVGTAVTSASAVYLIGPSLSATVGMTFAGSPVSVAGAWHPAAPYDVPVSGGKLTVNLPAGSAALVRAR
jgi:hypothetical protein